MRNRRRREGFRQPTLVPLADMLCNTLGIVIFIMVFTVIGTGNAVTHTAFPMEKTDSRLDSFTVVCKGNRICPSEPALADFMKVVQAQDRDKITSWTYDDNNCLAHFEMTTVSVSIEAKPNGGDTPGDVDSAGSALRTLLSHESPSSKFVYFLVYPDSLGAFAAARKVATESGFQVGWGAEKPDEPVRFGFGGGGSSPVPQ